MLPLQRDSHDRLASRDAPGGAGVRDIPANLLIRKYTESENPDYSVCAFVLAEPN